MYSSANTACGTPPPINARTADFIALSWLDKQTTLSSVTTTMPFSSSSHSTHSTHLYAPSLPRDNNPLATPSASSARAHNQSSGVQRQYAPKTRGNAGATETSLPLNVYPGIAPCLSQALSSSSGTDYRTNNVIRTALPLLMQNNMSQTPSAGRAAPNPLASTLARDALLIYAHRLFNSFSGSVTLPRSLHRPVDMTSSDHPYSTQLLPLLQRLRALHPHHLPTLLLLGCVHYAVGSFEESISVNEEILRMDADFVEAMSNLGTTLKAMGRPADAIQWWWKAVQLRPYYWDAVNNLLGALVSEEQSRFALSSERTYAELLRLCDTVRSRLISTNGEFLVAIHPQDMNHLQNILYVGGSIRSMSIQRQSHDGLRDYVLAIEVLLHCKGPVVKTHYSFRHFLLAGCISALLVSSSLPAAIVELAQSMGYSDLSQVNDSSDDGLLEFARNAGDRLWQVILSEGEGTFPPIFASPEQATTICREIFRASSGSFPSLCTWSESDKRLERPSEEAMSKVDELASNTLLGIAKIVQDSKSVTIHLPGFDDWIRVGPSLPLLLCYLAFAVFPSPSACNNLGILLSTIPWMDRRATGAANLAKAFYVEGLKLNPSHTHLLTNMGSLLKETGQLGNAVEMYTRAVQADPTFDVALANLANSLKDLGRLPEAIVVYRRAIEINDELPEALCGLAHAAWSICDWRGFGPIDAHVSIDVDGNFIHRNDTTSTGETGWMPKLILMTKGQLSAAYQQNVGLIKATGSMDQWIAWIEESVGTRLPPQQRRRWVSRLQPFFNNSEVRSRRVGLNEGGFLIRVVEWLTRHLQWRWYLDVFGTLAFSDRSVPILCTQRIQEAGSAYNRPQLPPSMSLQLTPSVLPFHTFIYPLSAREIRLVAHRNAARVSHSTLTRSWLPEHVYPPPPPPCPRIKVGYVSSDFVDHPTAHLINSVFAMHDRTKFSVAAYATSESDGSMYRAKVEDQVEIFRNVSAWTTQAIVEQILTDGIHILVNLNGYTKGSRNDIFAARPCPIQILFLGFAGTLASGWCDYLICDPIACPPSTRTCELCDKQGVRTRSSQGSDSGTSEEFTFDLGPDPDSMAEWKYIERLIYMPHTYLVTDHKQLYGTEALCLRESAVDPAEQWRSAEEKRLRLRRMLFPDIFDETIIFANFNQMYKLDPLIFATWLRILKRVPNSILWLLRFPQAAEEHLLRTALQWEDPSVVSRLRFTDVVTKDEHIDRAGVADIFLDTVECNAHTVAADVLWGGTPIITWPKYSFKMCSRVGASIAFATGYGHQMVADSLQAYEERAVSLALSVTPSSFGRHGGGTRHGELADLRRNLFTSRETMPLFDCQRWTRNLEKGFTEAWKRWIRGGTTTHFNVEGGSKHRYERCNGFIWIKDEDT